MGQTLIVLCRFTLNFYFPSGGSWKSWEMHAQDYDQWEHPEELVVKLVANMDIQAH